MIGFTPTWQKFDAKAAGFEQFRYLFDKDVQPEWTKLKYDGLNEGRKMAVRFYWFTAELNNGGLPQYFWNSSGDFITDQLADLDKIGCQAESRILSDATHKIFGSGAPSTNTTERRTQIQSYYGTHPFNDDDDRERLSQLEDKDDLRSETDLLTDVQKSIAKAMCAWFRSNTHFFTRLADKS
jgi:hypothetical protein